MANLVIAAFISAFLLYFYAFVWLFFLRNNRSRKRKGYYYFLVERWKRKNRKTEMPVNIVFAIIFKAVFDMKV